METIELQIQFWRTAQLWSGIFSALGILLAVFAQFKISNLEDKTKGRPESARNTIINNGVINNSPVIFNNDSVKTIIDISEKPIGKLKKEAKEEPKQNIQKIESGGSGIQNNAPNYGYQAGRDINIITDNSVSSPVDDNYLVEQTGNTFKIRPKSGIWRRPYVVIPISERETCQPEFSHSEATIAQYSTVDNKDYYGFRLDEPPASKDFYFEIAFKQLPTHFVFGYEGSKMRVTVNPK